jgi:hypothetical protein
MVAVWRLYGHERVCLFGGAEMSLQTAMAVMLALSLVMAISQAGWLEALIQTGGGASAWLYLALRWTYNREQAARRVTSERARHLEI